MANGSSGISSAFKKNLLNGWYAFGTSVVRANSDADVFKMALYLATASITTATDAYTATGEVNAGSANYAAGGVAETNATAPDIDTGVAFWQPSASVVWTNLTSGGSFDGVLLYNDTRADGSVAFFNISAQTVTAGLFTLTMPTPGKDTGLIRIS